MCNTSKGNAMAENRRAMHEVVVPDLLAALTAYGLGGSRPLPHARRPTMQRSGMKYIARFFDWLNAGIAEGERMRREAYLAQSSDHCDLEYRIRELERDLSAVPGW